MKKKRLPLKIKRLYIISSLILLIIVGFLYFTNLPTKKVADNVIDLNNLSGKYESGKSTGVFIDKIVSVPRKIIESETSVLGESSNPNKHIYVDLTNQRLYAMEGNKQIYDFTISSGKWGRTPTGDFKIWIKLRYTLMAGGSKELHTYYYLPNVPYTMFFYNDETPKYRGFGLHGTYWHNNFGQPMSHGCINMKTEDAGKLFVWASPTTKGNSTFATEEDPGTPITIFGEAPLE